MNRIPLLLSSSLLFLSAQGFAQITPGNLVVLRVGDGTAALSNAAQAVFLDEYTPSGTFVASISMPTLTSGTNLPLTNSGTATSEGFLNLSADGRYVLSGGYAATPGTAAIAATTSATVNRVIGRVALDGTVDTSTALTDAFSGNNIRSAASLDGSQFWAAGANGGIRFTTIGATSSISLNSTAPTNNRVVGIHGGQLYTSSATGAFQGISTVGVGLPTTGGETITLLPGFPTTAGPSAYDFFFADPATLYVADDRTNGSGGIQKWTLSGGVWSLQYTLALASTVGCRGLSGSVSGGITTLYATTTASQIVTVVDTGATATVNLLVTSAANTVFRGLRLIPSAGLISRVVHGCGQTTITTTGQPTPGGALNTSLGNVAGVPFVGLGFVVGNLPFCGVCTIGHDWVLSLPTAILNFTIPNNPTFVGVTFALQGAEALGLGGCPDPQVTLTDTMVIRIR